MSIQNTAPQAQNLCCFIARLLSLGPAPAGRGQIGPHAGGADGHGRGIVQQGRGGRRQYAENPQRQQAGVDGQNRPVVAVNALQHPLGEAAQGQREASAGGCCMGAAQETCL